MCNTMQKKKEDPSPRNFVIQNSFQIKNETVSDIFSGNEMINSNSIVTKDNKTFKKQNSMIILHDKDYEEVYM